MTLVQQLSQAMLNLRNWEADKKHQQGYGYISADAVLTRVGRELGDAGVVVLPSVTEQRIYTVENATKSGGSRFDAVVTFHFTIVGEGGETLGADWTGHGSDFTAPDKAIYKAITSGHKYFLMKLLNIGVGNEDSEHEVVDPAVSAKKAFLAEVVAKVERYRGNHPRAGRAIAKVLNGRDFDSVPQSQLMKELVAYAAERDEQEAADAVSAAPAKLIADEPAAPSYDG